MNDDDWSSVMAGELSPQTESGDERDTSPDGMWNDETWGAMSSVRRKSASDAIGDYEAARRDSFSMPVASERRKHQRTLFVGPVLLDSQKRWCRGRGLDVSVGGIAVEVDIAFEVGTELDVYFEINGDVSVETRGKVLRADGGHLVIEFCEGEFHLDGPLDEPFAPALMALGA